MKWRAEFTYGNGKTGPEEEHVEGQDNANY